MHDAVANEIFPVTDRTAEFGLPYIAAVHSVKRRNEPGLLVRVRTTQQIDEFDVHGRYARDNRNSSMFTDAG
jgi:hypothetical protein